MIVGFPPQPRAVAGIGAHGGRLLTAYGVLYPSWAWSLLSLPSPEFTRGICSAIHDRDHAAFLIVLASRPDLDLYHRIYEGPGFRAYLQRSTGSHACQAALIRFPAALRHFHVTAARQQI